MDDSQNLQPLPGMSMAMAMSPVQPHQPQHVLAEARKNLQVLIDSGLSKDLLHQWVDDSQSLPQLQQSLASPQNQQHQAQHQQHQPPPRPSSYIPPPPQCPPPPVPTQAVSMPVSVPMQQQQPQQPMTTSAASSSASTSPAVTTPTDIKTETVPEDAAASWPPTPSSVMHMAVPEADHANANAAAMFMAPNSAIPFSHRPRISVSSTSSGSSGRASIWSTNSAQSAMSWSSGSTASRCHAPLPVPPAASGPIANGAAAGKLNIYWCTSCETSFKRKYDWKRHEDEFHERWRKYPCPEPGCNRSFWGSNSFNQHHKQCHGCLTCPHAEKVVKFLRKRKYWACGFCSALHPARERHVEHVARHFENGLTKSDWMHSRVVYGLLHQPLIHEAWDAFVNSKQSEYNGRRPQFSWHPSKTGRAQGFLEKENPGQLQDLLEFFSGDDGEAQWIVSIAYELADIVLTTPPPVPVPSPQFAHESMGPPGYAQDPRMSFATLPSQAGQPPMLPSTSQPNQNPFSAPFRNTMFVPSQGFPNGQQHSPESASQSPLTTSHSPIPGSSQSPHDKRDLPPPPNTTGPSANPSAAVDGMMDFEYATAPAVFEDWESLNSVMVDDPSSQQPNHVAQPDWNMVQYFNDPNMSVMNGQQQR